MHSSEEDDIYIKQEDFNHHHHEEDNIMCSPITKRRRKLSDNNTSDSSASTTTSWSIHSTSPKNNNHNIPPVVIRPLPRVLPSPILPPTTEPSSTSNHILAESLLQVTREKEAGRMKRSQDMLQFLREKRMERDQLLIEKELTKRVKAKAELVKNLMEAGFDKNAIAEQLNML